MRFYADRPDVLTPVEWFWSDEDAPWLPFENTFTSRNWLDSQLEWPLLGEVQGAARPWRSGKSRRKNLNRVPCGTAAMFMQGVPFSQRVLNSAQHFDGSLVCCGGQTQPEGAVIDGAALVEMS